MCGLCLRPLIIIPIYGKFIHYIRKSTPLNLEWVIVSQPKTSFLRIVFDGDHDFEGLGSLKAHLDTVNCKPVAPRGPSPYVTSLSARPPQYPGTRVRLRGRRCILCPASRRSSSLLLLIQLQLFLSIVTVVLRWRLRSTYL